MRTMHQAPPPQTQTDLIKQQQQQQQVQQQQQQQSQVQHPGAGNYHMRNNAQQQGYRGGMQNANVRNAGQLQQQSQPGPPQTVPQQQPHQVNVSAVQQQVIFHHIFFWRFF